MEPNRTNLFKQLAEKYPFITFCTYGAVEYIGIVQNRDSFITTIYDFGSLHDIELKKRYIELANVWWWESNRQIPINIFLKSDWDQFKPSRRTFSNKDLVILHGPACSLNDIVGKKSKRRSITLVKKIG